METAAARLRAALVAVPLLAACYYYDLEGMALRNPVEGIVVGDTVRLSLVTRDGDMPSGPSVRWASTDTAVATVDERGVVTGIAAGVAGIDAWAEDYHLRLPVLVWAPAGPFTEIALGASHGCGLDGDGRAWCWGADEQGQLGTLTYFDQCVVGDLVVRCAVGAVPVDSEARFSALAAGVQHTCALVAGGAVHCWGLGHSGELREPRSLPGAHRLRAIGAGARCGLSTDDELLCWGADAETAAVDPGRSWAAVASGTFHSCAVTTTLTTWCWGNNGHGELGVDDVTCASAPCQSEPQEVAAAPPLVDLALGRDFSCGLTAGGSAWCWGRNDFGQLGDGTRTDRPVPMPVSGGHVFTSLAAGEFHACGIDGDGQLFCWGGDRTGFGNGADPAESAVEADVPIPGASGLRFTSTRIGGGRQCGLDDAGVAWCWGGNATAGLGNGTAQRFPPITVPTRVVRHPVR